MTPQDSNEETDGAVAQERLVRLLARFRGFVSARRETAENWRDRGQYSVASMSDTAADHFERCANELERTLNGETPADPGRDWSICETNAKGMTPGATETP